MKAIVALRNPASYPVRLEVFLELSRHVSELILLTDEMTEEQKVVARRYDRFSVHELGHENFSTVSTHWLEKHVLQEVEPTVVHSIFGHLVRFFEAYGRECPRRFRLVHTQYTANHDWFATTRFQDFPMSYQYLGQRIKSYWNDRRMAASADSVFVVCPAHRQGLQRAHGLPPEKICAVPSEVDSSFYNNQQPIRQKNRKLIFVGACYKNKGLDVLFDALPQVFAAVPQLEVELFGRTVKRQYDWFVRNLESARAFGSVQMKGVVQPQILRRAFADADVLVSPSRFEGSPRAVREALAGGCPCLLSAIPGHYGLDPHGEYVDFVDGFDSSTWAKAIINHFRQDDQHWQSRAEAGVAAMVERHSPKAVAGALFGAYKRLFSES